MDDQAPPSEPPGNRRGGRRRKPDAERHDTVIRVRMTPEGLAAAKRLADEAGLSLSEFGRAALDGNPVTVIVSRTAPPEVIHQLRMIGGNVRQGIVAVQGGCFADPALEQEVGAALAAAGRAVSDQLHWLIHGSEC